MKKKLILIFMIVLAMGMTACSSESKGDAVSVETDSRQETDKEETADMKTTETNDAELPKPEPRSKRCPPGSIPAPQPHCHFH